MQTLTIKFFSQKSQNRIVTALFDTGATCSCISKQVFQKILDKINLIRKPLNVNTASRATLSPLE